MDVVLKYWSIWGLVSVAMLLFAPILWVLHSELRPRRWLCHAGLVLCIVGFVFALVNSRLHVWRIQVDRSEEVAAAQERQARARQAALDAREGDVAQVRFAEDAADDVLDEGGMDEADLKYIQSIQETSAPEWKREKKDRSGASPDDGDLESMLGGGSDLEGVESDSLDEDVEPILLPERHVFLVRKANKILLGLFKALMLVGIGVVVVDYLARANVYEEAYLPLPLPSQWTAGLTPLPDVRALEAPLRRSFDEELEWLVRRGDVFLLLMREAAQLEELPDTYWRVRRPRMGPVDCIVVENESGIDADFVFESLWYGRACFAAAGEDAEVLLARVMKRLAERRNARARARHAVHVIWDMGEPLPEGVVEECERVAHATGVSFVVKTG